MNLCLICLRTDRLLKIASRVLDEFHYELCEFTVGTIASSWYYCYECEHLLLKFYKFKQKCVQALNIYHKWKMSKVLKKPPITHLHKNLPSTLGMWVPSSKIGSFQIESTDLQTNAVEFQKPQENTCTDEIKLENDQICLIDNNFTDILKIEHTTIIPKAENEETNKSNNKTDKDHLETKLDDILDDSKRFDKISHDTESFDTILDDSIKLDIALDDSGIADKILNDSERFNTDVDDKEAFDGVLNDSDDESLTTVLNNKRKKSTEISPDRLENVKKFKSEEQSQLENVKKNTRRRLNQLKKVKKTTRNRQVDLEKVDRSTSKGKSQLQKITKTTRKEQNDLGKIKKTTRKGHNDLEKVKKTTRKEQNDLETVKKTTRQNQLEKVKENDGLYKAVFDIEYLTTQEMKIEEFEKRKTYECYVSAEHKCEICYQVFKSAKFVEYHTNKWHSETSGSVCCPICKIWQSRRSSHHLTHSVVFKCKLCPLVTYHRDSMQNHCLWHQGKQYHCEQCNASYKSNSAYRTHLGKVHRRGRNVCQACGRGFYSPLGLSIHKNTSSRCNVRKALPKDTESVRCEDCDVTLPSKEVFEAHLADVHDAPKVGRGRPMAVDSSGLPEYRISNRKKRTRKARVPAQHTCRVCNEVGVSFGWLQLHFRKLHPNEDMDALYADKKTQLCDICGTGFSQIYALRDHMNIHTGARPHACDLCPKRFRSAVLKNEHRLRHFPSTKACHYCGKGFKTLANLNNHVRIHVGEKNYKCDICSKAFLHSTSLREHVRGVHYNIRRTKRAKVAPSDGKHSENSD